jgi:hypothetical protein
VLIRNCRVVGELNGSLHVLVMIRHGRTQFKCIEVIEARRRHNEGTKKRLLKNSAGKNKLDRTNSSGSR